MTCFLLFIFSVGWFLIEGTEVWGIFEGTWERGTRNGNPLLLGGVGGGLPSHSRGGVGVGLAITPYFLMAFLTSFRSFFDGVASFS